MGAMVQIPTLFVLTPSQRGIGGICSSGLKTSAGTMNKTELARKIQAIDGLSNEEKTALLELIRGHKKYGLVWEDKPEDIEEQLREDLPVLVERNDDKVHPIISDNPDAPNHLIIEGDNLAALTELSYTHAGKIDVIYIDPPYNTGNKDFVYNDSYVDGEDSFRHSKWLSFIAKRLRIAKQLLSDGGLIFISIDDHEQGNLKVLCDEIFLENNFIATFSWVKKKKGSHLSKTVRSMTEYVLCYAMNYSSIELYGENAYSDKQQPLAKRTNSIKRLSFPANLIQTTLKDGTYSGKQGLGTSASTFLPFTVQNGIVITECIVDGPFIWTQPKLDEELSHGTQVFLSSKFGFNVLRYNQGEKIKRPSTLIDNTVGVGTNEDAYNEIIEIFNAEGVMSYPKPTSLIKYLVRSKTYFKLDSIVLDFFAGSGTTLHAVMSLNAEDGGKRTCILCTNNENGICENVTYERNKRVIEGYTKPNGDEVAGLTDNNLRYYHTEFLPRERSVKNMRELVQASTGLLCIKNDLYTEATFGGRKMNAKYARYFENAGKRMLVIFEERAIPFIADIIKTMPEGEKIKVYVFSHGSYAYDDEFAEVENRVELCALPQAIYDAYQKVLPKRKPKFLVEDLVEEIVENEAAEAQGTLDFGIDDTEEGGDE